ncbi:MAG: hypothetical protein EOM04_07070 [Clostridia bacterium]|nr:hypothetical protein [Clostridia bacterium]
MNFFEGESKYIEYKKEYSNTILKSVSAFANYQDGVIVIGITDEGSIIGVSNGEELKLNIENAINDNIIPKPFYELETIEKNDKKLLLLKVYKGEYTPYLYKNKAYMRRDTSSVQTDKTDMENLILQGRNLTFEDLQAKEQDLSFKILETLLKKELKISSLSEDLLITLDLKNTQGFNNAAALLADENPLESSKLQLISYMDHSVRNIKDRDTVQFISILKQYEKCIEFYRKHINVSEIIKGPYREIIEEVPFIAYREAVANLIIHRDYSKNVDSRIEFFSDRIEIISPGSLPSGISEEEFLEGRISNPRNKKIAHIFYRLKIIEKLATGIRRIKEIYSEYKEDPEFIVTENTVVVVLPKINVAEIIMPPVRENDGKYLTLKEEQVYDFIRRNPGSKREDVQKYIGLGKTQTNTILTKLRDQAYIIKIGNGPATAYKIVRKVI